MCFFFCFKNQVVGDIVDIREEIKSDFEFKGKLYDCFTNSYLSICYLC